MSKPNVKTSKLVIPIIYGYTTPEIRRHDGCTKMGDTERDAEARIGEQTNTSDVEYRIEWTENAVFSGKSCAARAFVIYLNSFECNINPCQSNKPLF